MQWWLLTKLAWIFNQFKVEKRNYGGDREAGIITSYSPIVGWDLGWAWKIKFQNMWICVFALIFSGNNFYRMKMIYASWNGFCWIPVSKQLFYGHTREQKLEVVSHGEMTPTPLKNWKNKFVLKSNLSIRRSNPPHHSGKIHYYF